ncbi:MULTISPECIES: zinc-ribbon and DUF3426 domain-containing protein [Acinetobacter]|uniref:DUF3426 domain-containing protein n=1 Tax=Acinetobacter wuhouensis TaxID=1879050 RepID=A0A3G2T2H9_9GAMM|nr:MULTISPECIES: zinc-ribbon and DUF3426 domain-containing protein [Acinetobacter]AYO53946.1 DUF3426 domain-containing protein [Acinetobacter wuhouensis]RZG49251.1 DUF3426 domain-containing protein [Acinetobacter wuhouensis]RZG75159.1 DUF3426 domain-containing protein [Acinetobacter wuhouensis]RZG77712.1 DUF3426 domain-containing protein [Acinetobacter sp. WCHAc060025]
MAEKQTICPNCASIYKVSVTQLTVAQGMVCCPKCSHDFNALLHLQKTPPIDTNIDHTITYFEEPQDFFFKNKEAEFTIYDIFKRKVENSNIDLKTYLNNLNYFNNEPINVIPSLNLAQGIHKPKQDSSSSKSVLYYAVWSLINLALFSVLLFQIVWFNPKLTDQYPIVNSIFTKTCAILRCDTIDQRYKKVIVQNIKVISLNHQQTQFTGQINNQYSKSLELPILKLTLKDKGNVVNTSIITSDEYLIDSLQGIKRIPQNSPYPFKFVIKQPRNSFDEYEFVIIHP